MRCTGNKHGTVVYVTVRSYPQMLHQLIHLLGEGVVLLLQRWYAVPEVFLQLPLSVA